MNKALEGLDWEKLFEMVRPYFEAMDKEGASLMQFTGGGPDNEPIAMIVLVIDKDRIQQVAVTLDILRSGWEGGESRELRIFNEEDPDHDGANQVPNGN